MAMIAMLPVAALSQFDFGGGAKTDKPWEEFKLNSKTRVQLSFHNAGVDNILALYEKLSGVTIVKDPALTGQMTITSAKQVSLNDAFQILKSKLNLMGYDLTKEENLLVIKGRKGANARPQNNIPQFDPSQIPNLTPPESKLKVYPIQYANASQLARVINDVFQGTGAQPNQQPFGGFGRGGFGGGGGRGGFGGGNQRGGGGGGGNPFAQFIAGLGNQSTGSSIRASSDDFSNSVIVNAPDKDQGQVKTLIDQLDKQTDQPQLSKVFKLVYASSDDLAPVVQNVLVSNAPRGKGGIGTQNVPIDQRFQQAARFGSTQAAFGQVASEPRTNSLVVTATQENLVLLDKVIKELDQPVALQSSTFVFPLANARADAVANLLSQAFGQRQGTGTSANRNTTNNANTISGRNSTSRSGGAAGRTGAPTGLGGNNINGNNIEMALADPEAQAGELQTNIDVAQGFGAFGGGGQNRGFGGGGGFGQQQNRNTTQTTGRDAQGRLVNVRDLTGQVTTIADPNTNSIIIVTNPENAEIIRSVLEQLDRIPEQVMIETIIAEATLDAETKMGVEWKYAQSKPFKTPGSTGTAGTDFGQASASPALQGFRYTLTGGALTGFVNALKTDSKFTVLSTPRIFTSNNSQAEINISQSIPYVLSSRQDANGNLSYNYSFLDVGIILTVTPHITSNGYVTMDVSQTANDLQEFTSFNAPIVNQRQADTTVSVKDGETIILGGIIRNSVTVSSKKIPILGEIPILGNLFKSTDHHKTKTELMVFLTPHVVRDPDEARRLREQSEKQLSPETQKSLGTVPKTNNGGEKGTGNNSNNGGNGAGKGTGGGGNK